MHELIVDLDRISIRPELLVCLRKELSGGGLWAGRFTVGNVTAAPEMIYFLWHEAGEVPVSMLFRRECLTEESSICASAREFLKLWRRRLD